MFVVSERAVDGGWHHVHANAQQLHHRLSTYVCWCNAIPFDGTGIDAVAPAPPLLVVSLAGGMPVSHEALSLIATADSGEVLFEPAAAAAWRMSGAADGHFRDGPSAAPMLSYEHSASTEHLTDLQRAALNPIEYAYFRSDISPDIEWQSLCGHARKVWGRLIPLLPFHSLRQCALLWPGLIAYSKEHVGKDTIAYLTSCNTDWASPSASASGSISGRPGLNDLHGTLVTSKDGRTSLDRLIAMSAAGYDSICVQERHLEPHQRKVLGAALDRVAARPDQCLSLSPMIRSTPVRSMGKSGWAENFAAKLGVDCYGDLGWYCFGFRVARECPARKQNPQYVVTELTRAVDRRSQADLRAS